MASLLCGKVGLEQAIGVDEDELVQFVLQRRVDNAVSHPYSHTVPRPDAERRGVLVIALASMDGAEDVDPRRGFAICVRRCYPS